MPEQADPIRLLVIPGLHDSGPAHWQSWLQSIYGPRAVRVEQDDWARPDLLAWSQRIESTLARQRRARWIAVAHSFGCLALAHRLQQGSPMIRAALLVAPADPVKFGVVPLLERTVLPVASVLLASRDDPWMTFEAACGWADAWGTQTIDLGAVGHINTDAGFGPLPIAKALVERMRCRLERARRPDRAHPLEYAFSV